MKILLINPEWVVKSKENLWSKVASCYPSLGLAYIAAVLEKEGHTVKILDMLAEQIGPQEFNRIKMDYDIAGITATTPLINNALKLARSIKKKNPKTKVILGGVHPTVMDREVISNLYVDIVVRGEGEYTFRDIANGIKLENIPGITFRNGRKIVRTPDRNPIENLDELPIPAYHLLPIRKYRPAIGSYRRLPAMSIFATRGCPGRCTFCCRMWENIRYRSAEKIIEEIKVLQRNYGIREISFYDDTFTAIKQNVKRFCELLLKEKIDITWSCFTRVNYIDLDLFKLMKKAGCHLVLFGVESGSQHLLDKMNKRITLNQIRNAVNICKSIGLKTRASYIFGTPGETAKTIKQTVNFALELDTDYAQFNIMTAYPGTELWKEAKEKGWLIVKDYDYSVSDFTMNLPTISNRRMMKMYKWAHRKYYLRPKMILRHIMDIKNPVVLIEKIKGGFAVLLSR